VRDEKNEDVSIIRVGDKYYPVNNSAGLDLGAMAHLIENLDWISFNSYEEALEKVCLEALKIID
jgi:hypothetical protein